MMRNHQLERERLSESDRMARQRDVDIEEMRKQAELEREAMRRQTEREVQEERRRTDEHRAMLERENMRARAIAEAEGRIREQRENEDIFARQIALKGEQTVKQVKAAVQTTVSELGGALGRFITDYERVGSTVFAITALAAGIFAVRETSRVAGRLIERRLLTPQLVRETSRSRSLIKALTPVPAEETGLTGIVLAEDLATQMSEISVATRNTKKNSAPFRHMLFYGPPGTGKTMVAKRLARTSGLDYAIMSGGDVGPLGKDAVTELHKVFDWGERSSKGLLLFIDEADAFLASRSRASMSEDHRNALNALLYRTGEASKSLMLVLATNRPGDLDAAISDRVDDALLFGSPDQKGREKLLKLYFEKYVQRAGEGTAAWYRLGSTSASATIKIADGFTDEYFADLARRTKGFSGRAISKLMLAVQGTVYGRQDPVLTMEVMETVVTRKLAEFDERITMAKTGVEFTDLAKLHEDKSQ
jgi:ATPase family AAA domain-containing protein 3A/B